MLIDFRRLYLAIQAQKKAQMLSKPTWKDVTSYSRGEADRTPRSWRLEAGLITIMVTRHIDLEPDEWLFSVPTLHIDTSLGKMDAEKAKEQAVRRVRNVLENTLKTLEGVS